ncbi:MAG TPA: tRNA uridine-5-carboxymethylaminomethyl(34) synthesis GTPase MnmE [Puia sp.]|nr:tRNA uridine-5-carboxymethylaminomethyl(34) synthesis GTPase MnmE [Puia sp.]
MLGKLTGWDDTIVALATPPGIGAIGVIRLSGSASWPIVDKLFPSKDLEGQPSHTLHVGFLKEGEEALDEVVVSLYRGPRSYTGEDVVEVSCHGSPYVQERVIQAFLRQGARMARAGEFTQRAFLHGKFDLTQAEAVADLIASNTAASARTALHTIRGGFSRALKELRVQMISFSALIELELDFSQEDVEFADRSRFYALITESEDTTAALLQSFRLGNVIRNGVQVAIVGKPNAGKSTLLNTLLNENRAIVSEIAGTTRDTIEEILNIDGILFRLIDTAGIRRHTTDLIESMGMEKSLEKIEQADIVLYLFDVNDRLEEVEAGGRLGGAGGGEEAGLDPEGETLDVRRGGEAGWMKGTVGMTGVPAAWTKNILWVGNKVDAFGEGNTATDGKSGLSLDAATDGKSGSSLNVARGINSERSLHAASEKFRSIPGVVFISARQGLHVDLLKRRLVDLVLDGKTGTEGTIVTNIRHYHALQQVAASLGEIHKGLDEKLPGDLLSLDIRSCLHALGEITGEITSEDQLDYIFSKFCIGK